MGPNQGIMTVRVPSVSIIGSGGGFSYDNTKKYVCQII